MREPYLSQGAPMSGWAPQGSVKVWKYGETGIDINASLQLDRNTVLILKDSAQLRQLAAVARRLAFQMELAEETGQQPAAGEVAA